MHARRALFWPSSVHGGIRKPQRTRFGGSAPARLVNLGSRASGTSGCVVISERRASVRASA
jgi:hypothetical protein